MRQSVSCDPLMMKSTTVRILGESRQPSFGSRMPRDSRFSRSFCGMDRLRSTGCTLPPRTTSKFRSTRVRSMRPFSFALSQPLWVQLRWCSLLCAVVNPFFAWKWTTCFCLSISSRFMGRFLFPFPVPQLAALSAILPSAGGPGGIELPPSLRSWQNGQARCHHPINFPELS